MVNSAAHLSTPPLPTHCHEREFLKNLFLKASRQTCYLKSGQYSAHPLIIFHLMLLSLPCLALGDTELEAHVGKACGPGSGEHLDSEEAQRKGKPQMRRTGQSGNGCALPRKRFSRIRAF